MAGRRPCSAASWRVPTASGSSRWSSRLIDDLPLAERVEALGIPLRVIGMRPGVPDPRGVIRLARLLHRERPQVVQTWQDHSNLIGGVAARRAAGPP